MLRQQQLFIRRDSDAPRSPSSSETDEPLHHTAVPARPPRSPRKRPPSWTNSRVGGPGGSPRSARHGEADDDADVELEQEVQTPGMEISFDIDSDVSPCISSDELAPSQLPPTYTERPFQPHTHLAPHSSRPFNPHRPYTSPSPPSYPSSSQSSFHYSHKVRPSALASARSLSFAHAHAQRQTRIQGRHTQAEGDPNYDVGALGTSRPKDAYGRLDQHQAGELSEVGGLSFPEFILGLEDASEGSGSGTRSATISQSSNRGRVPLPISISFESDMSEDETPGTASTLRTARPRGNIFNTAGDFTYRTQRATRPPATASPSYRLGWRHRAAPPPLIRSASCPFIGGISGDTASVQQHAAADSLTSPFDYAQHIGQAEETAIMRQSQFGDKLVVEPSQTLRRAMSTGSRSKRNTFGPCEIYDDAGGEFPGTGYPGSINIGMSTGVPVVSTGANHSTPAAQDTIPRRMPARSITDDSLANGRHHGDDIPPTGAHALRVQQRCCPSQPCSAGPSPTQGPTTVFLNPNDFGTLPASVQMTPTSSLDGIVGVIQAAGVLASEIEVDEDAWTESKDGLQESKDGSDYAGYEQSADTIAIACTDNAAADLDHNALPNQAETSTDEYGRVRNAKGPIDGGWQSEKDVSGVYALGNDSPILPHDPLPPISSFTPTAGQSDEGTPPAPPPASLERDDAVDAGDALDPLDDSLIHSTSVNNTQPCSTVSYTCVSLQHTNSLSTPSPDSETLRDSISLSTPLEPPLASSSTRPDTSVKGAVSQSTGERKEISREDGQHTPSPEIAIDRPAPKTPPTAHRVSVLYPTPPPLSALPPTPTSAPGDISRSVSRSSKRLSYQLSPSPSVRRALTVSSPHSNRTPSPTSRSSPLLPALSTPDRPRRATSVYVARSAEDQDTAGEEESNMALHVDIRSNQYPSTISHPGHQKQPSVPYSTRSTHSSFSTSTVPFDAPNNYFNRTSVQRLSRFTAASGSSGSSIYSSDSDAGIGKIQYRVTERPEISTVFEEEGSFDVSPGGHERYSPPLRHKQSNSTLDSAHCIPYSATRRQRAGTISSQFSGISDRSAHPFAASASRSMENRTGGLLKPAMPRLQPSRSSPNLRVMAKEGPLSIHQLTLADNSEEDDEKCPVCIESLNASFKLPGEKPHIVPECGHALHEECFTHVYGDVPSSGSTRNVGLCGVCRQPIKIAEGGGDKKGKRGKFAAMTGQGSGLRGGSSTSVNSSSPSVSSNLQANDPVVPMSSNSPKRGGIDSTPRIVIPHISVRPEMATMNRQKRQMAAMITVQLPSAGERERYPRPNRSKSEVSLSPALPPSPISTSSMDGMMTHQAAIGGTLPLEAVQADLERRLQDFGKSSLDGCGPLRLYDLLDVRKGDTKRPFLMYLFSDALACISEETPSALSKMFKSGGTLRASKSSRSLASAPPKTTLKLRGRIHFKHVRKVIDSSTANELSLTILMIDENHQTFILVFKDRMQYDLWRNMLDKIVKEVRDRGMSEKGGNSASKVAKLMGTGAPVALRKANPGISPSSTINSGMSGLGLGGVDVMSPSMSTYSHDNDVAPSYSTPLQPLGPIHTPVDLVIVLAIPQAASAPESAPLKIRLMRQALGFILATLGPGDRISLVSCEQGVNVRKTPLLCPTRPDSRRRLEAFVENLGTGGAQEDDTEVEFAPDERADLVTAMNVSLDVLLQRTAKNPLAGLVVVSDTAEVVRAGQLELIFARLDSVSIPIHTIGYGKAHDPRPLWLLCNQSNGTYTFVREWYHLRDTLAGIVGGLTSIAMIRARISLSCADKDFKIARIMGVQTPIPAQGAKTIDIELRDLRYGETREILVEFDYEGDGTSAPRSRPNTGLSGSFSMDRVSLEDPSSVVKDMLADGRLAEDIPVVEVDCSYHDPASGRSVSRLTQPLLLTIPIVSAPTPQPANSRILAFDPMVKRRRMEILASDMIARALLLMTRQNSNQAERLLLETRGVISRLISTIHGSLPHDRPASSRKEILAVQNADMMQSVADDLETLAEAVLDQPQVFERDHRNMATQQANILRTQRSWTTRSATERMYCTEEVRELLQLSGEWTVRA